MGRAAVKGSWERKFAREGRDYPGVPLPLGGNTVQKETLRTNGDWRGDWEVMLGGGAGRGCCKVHCRWERTLPRRRHGLATNAWWLEGDTDTGKSRWEGPL